MKTLLVAAVTAFSALAGAAPACATTPPPPGPQTASYGPAARHTLDAYVTPGDTARPWVVLIHGGSWRHGDKAGMAALAAPLRNAGFAVFAINYRLSDEAPWPAQRDDALAAIRYLKANAATYGIDPNRGAVYGHSAGGHIAAAVGTTGVGSSTVRAVVTSAAPLEPYRGWQYANVPAVAKADGVVVTPGIRTLAGHTAHVARCKPNPADAVCWARWRTFNLRSALSASDAPFLIVHGTGDVIVPAQESARFHTALKAAGIGSTYVSVTGAGHGSGLVFGDAARTAQAVAFLKAKTA